MTLDHMDLAELVGRMKGARSYADLEHESGGSPSRQAWQQMATGKPMIKFPDPATLRTLASVLCVSERTVILATARSLGLEPGDSSTGLAALLPPTADRLGDRQITAVLAVVRAMMELINDPPMNADTEEMDAALTAAAKREATALRRRPASPS